MIEQGLINYKDISEEIMSILKSKRDEIIFKMKLASKEEVDILNKAPGIYSANWAGKKRNFNLAIKKLYRELFKSAPSYWGI